MTLPVLFLIPARGGSVRLSRKNLRTVAGIPLVAHGIRIARLAAARVPGGPHAIVCSTDDGAIAEVARTWHAEVPFERPAALAGPTASSADVALHALAELAARGRRFRAVALIQPTAPLADPSGHRHRARRAGCGWGSGRQRRRVPSGRLARDAQR